MRKEVVTFNNLFDEFLEKIISKFDSKKLKTYRRAFLLLKDTYPETPVNLFMVGCVNYKTEILNRNDSFFLKDEKIQELIKAENENIEIIYVKSGNELVEFLNSRVNCTDSSSLISKLHYYGHATPGYLEIGYVNKRFWNKLISKTIPIKKINPNCFSDSAIINIVGGCRTSIKSVLTKKSVVDKFLNKTNGLVIASNVRVYYPGGPVSDKTLVKKNNGQILFFKGTKNDR